jgi:prepilin-type processing-associated H-X9-DG protein
MDENLIGYLLDALQPDERRAVESRLRSDPAARARLASLRHALMPLEADAEPPKPPPDLVARTLRRVAALAPPGLPTAPPVRGDRSGAGRFWVARADVLVAALLLVVMSGLGWSWLAGQWHRSQRVACAANLQTYWRGLETYSDLRDGRFPRIELSGPASFAGSFIPSLTGAGVLAPGQVSVLCPAEGRKPPAGHTLEELNELYQKPGRCQYHAVARELAGSYAYSLGYWRGTSLCGLRRDTDGMLPILADRAPVEGGNSRNHGGGGQNVLYVDGHVCWHTQTTVGPDGDDIFRNRNNQVLAGIDRGDVVLGASYATPAPAE